MLKSPAHLTLLRARADKRRGGATKIFSGGVTRPRNFGLRRESPHEGRPFVRKPRHEWREPRCSLRAAPGRPGELSRRLIPMQDERSAHLEGERSSRPFRRRSAKHAPGRNQTPVLFADRLHMDGTAALAVHPTCASQMGMSPALNLSAMMMQHGSSPCDGM